MTAITKPVDTVAQVERQQLERTFAMSVVSAGCWVMVAGVAYFLVYLIRVYAPASGAVQMVPNLTPIFISVGAIFGEIGRASGRDRVL